MNHKTRQGQTAQDIPAAHRCQSQSRSSGCGTTSQVQCILPRFVTETLEFSPEFRQHRPGSSVLLIPACDWHTKPSSSWHWFPPPSFLLSDFLWELQSACSWRICWLLFFLSNVNVPRSQSAYFLILRSWRWRRPRSSMPLLPSLLPSPFVQHVIVSYNAFPPCLVIPDLSPAWNQCR